MPATSCTKILAGHKELNVIVAKKNTFTWVHSYYMYRVCHPGGNNWDYYPGALSFESSHYNSFKDGAPVHEIYGCPIFKSVTVTWLADRVPG